MKRPAVEITAILCLKLAALFALWFFFVSGKTVPHGPAETGAHLMGSADD
jgi:hypothetical protein